MPTNRSFALAAGLVVLAVVFVVLAVLYAEGVIGFLSRDPSSPHHYTHAFGLAVLALASLIAANFARPKST